MDETKEVWTADNILKLREYPKPTAIDVEEKEIEKFRDKIEPWLTALCQSEHLALLTGSGISSAIHYLACDTSGAGMGDMEFSVFKEEIEKKSKETAERIGRGEPN